MDPGTLVTRRPRGGAGSSLLLMACAGLIPLVSACDRKETPAVPPRDLKLSAHPRAMDAAARVRPALEADLSLQGLRLGDPIFIRAFKEERKVELFVEKEGTGCVLFRTYPIAAASGTLGPKLAEGDGQVPEGFYEVLPSAMNPDSRYHLSFNIGFPNAYDRHHHRTGSLIMLHGNRISIGCLAMTDEKIEEIFTLADAALRNGQPSFPVHIFPFRMTPERMALASGNPDEAFWINLKEGYDHFEQNHTPPAIGVSGGRYTFR